MQLVAKYVAALYSGVPTSTACAVGHRHVALRICCASNTSRSPCPAAAQTAGSASSRELSSSRSAELIRLTSKACSAVAAAAAMYTLYQNAAWDSFVLSRTAPRVCAKHAAAAVRHRNFYSTHMVIRFCATAAAAVTRCWRQILAAPAAGHVCALHKGTPLTVPNRAPAWRLLEDVPLTSRCAARPTCHRQRLRHTVCLLPHIVVDQQCLVPI